MKKKLALFLSFLMALSACFYGMNYTGSEQTEVSAATTLADGSTLAEGSVTYNGLILLDMDELQGYATVDGETTGGYNGDETETVVVTTTDEFTAAVKDDEPRVVIVSGTIKCYDSGGYAINVGSNKTIVGIDEDATLEGGINISSESNIIVANLEFDGLYGASNTPSDCINVQYSDHIWFNHLDIHDAKDGNLDIKLGSDYITVSWCHFWYDDTSNSHRLSCLVSSGAGDHEETDYGKLHVTYHHNWFDSGCYERMPRVMYGQVHIYNNYYSCSGNLYCIGAGCYANILVEGNYFENVKSPHTFSYDDQTYPVCITVRDNTYVNTTGDKDSGQHPNAVYDLTPFETAPYVTTVDASADTKEILRAYAGQMNREEATATAVPVGTDVPAAEETETPTAQPEVTPTPMPESANDNAPSEAEDSQLGTIYTFNGQNSDGTNGYVEIENPFAGLELSETPTYKNGYPSWTNGVTLTYWEYIPSSVSTEAAVINFSGTHRAISYLDWPKYVDGTEEGYTNRYIDDDGNLTYSLIREGDVLSGLQITSYGSFGFSEDDYESARDENRFTNSYASYMYFQPHNYLYYFANTSGTTSTLVSEKGTWHFVAIVMQNDYIGTYVDGELVSTSAFNVWGSSKYMLTGSSGKYVSGMSFNLGYGWKVCRRSSSTSDYYSHGITLLDFLSLENTKLYIGGETTLWDTLYMSDYTTPAGIKIGGV